MTARSWVPKRQGRRYCAPACGFGCTWAQYREATRRAEALARKLGDGWTTDVRENLGWFWYVVSPCKRVSLAPLLAGKGFAAFVAGDVDPLPTPGIGRWRGNGRTARAAIRAAVKRARAEAAAINRALDGLSDYRNVPA